jgi:hypothetical protein
MSNTVDTDSPREYAIQTILDSDGLDALLDCLFEQDEVRTQIFKRIDFEEVLEEKSFRDIQHILDDYITDQYSEDAIIDLFSDIVTNNLSDEAVSEYIQREYFGSSRYKEQSMSNFIDFITELIDGNEYEFFKQYIKNDEDTASYVMDLLDDKFKEKYNIKEPVVDSDKPNINLESIKCEILSQMNKNYEEFNNNMNKFKDNMVEMIFRNLK